MMSPGRSKITPEREREFFGAVLNLLREGGYDALSMEGVAARTRCGKSTLYRQWGTKPQLVAAALRGTRYRSLKDIDTGSLEGDLREALRSTAVERGSDTELMHSLSHAMLQNPDLLQALRDAVIEPKVATINAMIRRAVERGEIDPDNPAAEFVAAQLICVTCTGPMLGNRLAEEAYLTRFLEAAILPGLGVRVATPS